MKNKMKKRKLDVYKADECGECPHFHPESSYCPCAILFDDDKCPVLEDDSNDN